jgi:hypothetical protein
VINPHARIEKEEKYQHAEVEKASREEKATRRGQV